MRTRAAAHTFEAPKRRQALYDGKCFRGNPFTQFVAASLIGLTLAINPTPVLAQLCASNPTYGGETGILVSIGGVVKDIETGQPIPDVHVTARTGQLTFSAVTNVFGAYIFQGVPPGKYALRFSRPVVYAFEPNPFPDLNLTPEPLIVDTNPCSNCNAQNVPDAHLKTYAWGVKVPSIMECGGLPCGHKVTVYDYDDLANATNPHCGTDACDGPEDFNRNPTTRVYKIIEKGFTLNIDSENPVPYIYVTKFEYNSAGQVSKIDGPREDVDDTTDIGYYSDAVSPLQRHRLHHISLQVADSFNQATIISYNASGEIESIQLPNGLVETYATDRLDNSITISNSAGKLIQYFLSGDQPRRVTISNRQTLDVIVDSSLLDRSTQIIFSELSASSSSVIIPSVTSHSVHRSGESQYSIGQLGNGALVERRFGRRSTMTDVESWVYTEDSTRLHSSTRVRTGDKKIVGNDITLSSVHSSLFGNREYSFNNDDGSISAKFLHNRRGLVESFAGFAGDRTTLRWDDMDRLVTLAQSQGSTCRYQFQADNSLAAEFNGQERIEYLSDELGRTTSISPLSLSGVAETRLTYDLPQQDCLKCAAGKLSRAVDQDTILEIRYDAEGRIASEARYFDGLELLPKFSSLAADCGWSSETPEPESHQRFPARNFVFGGSTPTMP